MKLPFSTIILVTLVLVFSVFFANLSNLIAIQVENSIIQDDFNRDATNEIPKADFNSATNSKREVTIKDGFKHLMWFMQVGIL